jgi:coenzyme F420-reducing hydrogenase delta subunit
MSFEPKIWYRLQLVHVYRADLAGTTRLQYPRISGGPRDVFERINPSLSSARFSWRRRRAVGGCHPGDCHYNTGNLYARRRLAVTKKILEFAGMEPGRFRVEWISASEATGLPKSCGVYRADPGSGPQTQFKISQ